MGKCIFCRITAKDAHAYPVYEDADVMAVLDIDPISEGHILILPKNHYSDADEMPEELYLRMQLLARRFVTVLKEVYGCDGYTVMQNGGKVSAIGHYHLHVFPRYLRDGYFVMTNGLSYRAGQSVADKIRKKFEELP